MFTEQDLMPGCGDLVTAHFMPSHLELMRSECPILATLCARWPPTRHAYSVLAMTSMIRGSTVFRLLDATRLQKMNTFLMHGSIPPPPRAQSTLEDYDLSEDEFELLEMPIPDQGKRRWTAAEDQQLLAFHEVFGNQWRALSRMADRSEDALRNRFLRLSEADDSASNASSASTRLARSPPERQGRTSWTPEEDRVLKQMVDLHDNKWGDVVGSLPGRTPHGARNRLGRLGLLSERVARTASTERLN